MPGLKPGMADKNMVRDALAQSDNTLTEQKMIEDKIKATDWEATNEAIEEQVENKGNICPLTHAVPRLPETATCSGWLIRRRPGGSPGFPLQPRSQVVRCLQGEQMELPPPGAGRHHAPGQGSAPPRLGAAPSQMGGTPPSQGPAGPTQCHTTRSLTTAWGLAFTSGRLPATSMGCLQTSSVRTIIFKLIPPYNTFSQVLMSGERMLC